MSDNKAGRQQLSSLLAHLSLLACHSSPRKNQAWSSIRKGDKVACAQHIADSWKEGAFLTDP